MLPEENAMNWEAAVANWDAITRRMMGDVPFPPDKRPAHPDDPVPDDPAEDPPDEVPSPPPVPNPNPKPGGG